MFFIGLMVGSLGSSLGTSMATQAVISRWFKKNVGKVNGITAMGIGLGGYCVPMLVFLIDAFTWRTALIMIAIGVAIIGISLSFVFRNRPEDYGTFPDGVDPAIAKASGKVQISEYNPNVKEALRTRAYWQMGISQMLHWANVGVVNIHIIPYLTSTAVGISRVDAAMVTMSYLLASVPARFMWGWLSDIFQPRFVNAISAVMMAIGLVFFAFIRTYSFWLAVPFIVIYGIGLGGVTPMKATLIREYFGARNFGAIFGSLSVFTMVTSVAASPLVGWFYDIHGTYDPTWLIMAGVTAVGAILMFAMPASEKRLRSNAAAQAKP